MIEGTRGRGLTRLSPSHAELLKNAMANILTANIRGLICRFFIKLLDCRLHYPVGDSPRLRMTT